MDIINHVPLASNLRWERATTPSVNRRRARSATFFCAVFFMLLATLSASDAAQPDTAPTAKIAPALATAIADGSSSEALLVLSEQADLSGADNLPDRVQKARYVYSVLRTVAERSQAPIRKMLQAKGIPFQSFYVVNMIKITAKRDDIYELAGRSDVQRIDANPHFRVALPLSNLSALSALSTNVTAATTGGPEWNVQKVNAPQVWALGFRGDGIVVAGADTGVQWDHVALKAHYRGWNGSTVDHSYSWHDATSDHSPTPVDPQFHGTFTLSEMVGDDGLGNQVGVAPGAKWIACRNMDKHGVGSPAQYLECFDFFLGPYPMGHPELADPTMSPDVINNSWDCPASEGCTITTLQSAVDAVRAAGIFQTMATGNSGSACSTVNTSPEIYASSFSVGATDSANNIAYFSSRGPVTVDGSNRLKPELVAPGLNIRGAIAYNNMYQGYWQGTSMAAPEVAGAVALLWQAKPALRGDISSTISYLTQNATPLTSTQTCGSYSGKAVPNAVFGYGLLNILKAVQAP